MSPHTCEAYAYSFQLLVCFAAGKLRIKPCQIEIEQLDAPLIRFLAISSGSKYIELAGDEVDHRL